MSLIKTNKLTWFNIVDLPYLVVGFAIVKKGFIAQLHRHKEEENYYFVHGTGKLKIGNDTKIVHSFSKIKIPSNIPHAMTPVTDHVFLVYTFRKGPFKNIEYYYLDSKL